REDAAHLPPPAGQAGAAGGHPPGRGADLRHRAGRGRHGAARRAGELAVGGAGRRPPLVLRLHLHHRPPTPHPPQPPHPPPPPAQLVMGGAAGGFPVLVGWSAVTGTVSAPAVVLFAVIFFWTPPHFWALAMKFKDDYAAAAVPMLPVVAPPTVVARKILLYSYV